MFVPLNNSNDLLPRHSDFCLQPVKSVIHILPQFDNIPVKSIHTPVKRIYAGSKLPIAIETTNYDAQEDGS